MLLTDKQTDKQTWTDRQTNTTNNMTLCYEHLITLTLCKYNKKQRRQFTLGVFN